ncbi:type II secretion system minor pseudopilin GspJ [Sansalvadorimonas sp. 2012CJ34-2]|uniref:Type II secretion system protein J n=1 Tax=Parendozoicomonas callyspongiae TaxID=2942213 RepID=A0ABT0PIQ8_9GAMM|nr:type II secretion system minor pseudopilin GspJ [Sansalvadorimonas sp. 2012CJ34-2]MCL6271146.1 type II secretion system minor pseudopilin GspJ [Sansalvadorimonas sp. 2012CJ34-2]
MIRRASLQGFTLLELLIAIAIFALLSAGCYRIFKAVTSTKEVTEAIWEYTGEVQKAFLIIQKDFFQVAIRPVRNELGDREPAVQSENGRITFTRHGWRNFTNDPRSELQRVQYLFDGGRLLKHYWQTLDRAPDTPFKEQVVLEDVQNFSVKFRDAKRRWHTSWPPASDKQSERVRMVPSAIEITLVHESLGTLQQLIPGPTFKPSEKKSEANSKGGKSDSKGKPPNSSQSEQWRSRGGDDE